MDSFLDRLRGVATEGQDGRGSDASGHVRARHMPGFAVLAAAMLRPFGVRSVAVSGWADGKYHAWNEVLVGSAWKRYDVTTAITGRQYAVYQAYGFNSAMRGGHSDGAHVVPFL